VFGLSGSPDCHPRAQWVLDPCHQSHHMVERWSHRWGGRGRRAGGVVERRSSLLINPEQQEHGEDRQGLEASPCTLIYLQL
jgi:hypothetical protein